MRCRSHISDMLCMSPKAMRNQCAVKFPTLQYSPPIGYSQVKVKHSIDKTLKVIQRTSKLSLPQTGASVIGARRACSVIRARKYSPSPLAHPPQWPLHHTTRCTTLTKPARGRLGDPPDLPSPPTLYDISLVRAGLEHCQAPSPSVSRPLFIQYSSKLSTCMSTTSQTHRLLHTLRLKCGLRIVRAHVWQQFRREQGLTFRVLRYCIYLSRLCRVERIRLFYIL